MAVRTTMNISLTPTLQRFVSARIGTGMYQSASEVVREGLRLLEQRERLRKAVLADLRAKVGVGLRQARRGELVDGEEVFAELEGRTTRPRRRHG